MILLMDWRQTLRHRNEGYHCVEGWGNFRAQVLAPSFGNAKSLNTVPTGGNRWAFFLPLLWRKSRPARAGAHPAVNRMKALLIALFILAMLFAASANLCRERRLSSRLIFHRNPVPHQQEKYERKHSHH
jgi:hypothetical protein